MASFQLTEREAQVLRVWGDLAAAGATASRLKGALERPGRPPGKRFYT